MEGIDLTPRRKQPASNIWSRGKADRVIVTLIEQAKVFRWKRSAHALTPDLKSFRVETISETQSFEGRDMPTTEESIIAAARLRAAYRGENEALAAASALEALAVLKKR